MMLKIENYMLIYKHIKYHIYIMEKIYHQCIDKPKKQLACFDLDSTLISPLNGKKFSISDTDWEFCPNVIATLKELSYTHSIVIFTNQLGIKKGKIKPENVKIKFTKIEEELGCQIGWYISTNDDIYRKPHTGMWKVFLEETKITKGKNGKRSRRSVISESLNRSVNIICKFAVADTGDKTT